MAHVGDSYTASDDDRCTMPVSGPVTPLPGVPATTCTAWAMGGTVPLNAPSPSSPLALVSPVHVGQHHTLPSELRTAHAE
jgi:hypothetical protein